MTYSYNVSKEDFKLNGILLCNKKEQITDMHNVNESQKQYTEQNTSPTKE